MIAENLSRKNNENNKSELVTNNSKDVEYKTIDLTSLTEKSSAKTRNDNLKSINSDKCKAKDEKLLDFEDVASELGYLGKYQIFHYLVIALPISFSAIFNSNFIFIAEETNARCKIPECESSLMTSEFSPHWLPKNSTFDFQCYRPVFGLDKPTSENCSADIFGGREKVECTEWVYEDPDSLVANLNLGCSPVQRSLIGTAHYAGMVVSMPIMGLLSDRFGRKVAYVICTTGGGIIGLMKAFITQYNVYVSIEFFESVVCSATYTIAFVLLVEMCGKDKRSIMAAICGIAMSLGELCFGFIASMVSNYKTLIIIIYAPIIICISYMVLIDESIRWLLTTGRNQKAREVINKAVKWNKAELSDNLRMKLDNIEKLRLNEVTEEHKDKINFKEIVTSKIIMTRLMIAIFWWFSSDLVYFGLLVSTVHLPGDKYQNFMYSAVAGIMGDFVIILTLNRYGRKKTLLVSFLICGLCIIGKSFIPAEYSWAEIALFLIGKMFIGTAYSSVYTYASELFPTEVRSLLVGFSSMFAGVGSIIAPMTPLLAEIMPQLPSLIFGSLALLSGFLAFFTPETLNKKLPDTIKEAEKLN